LEVAEVLFLPELKVNLLSVSALEDMGYVVMFVDGQVLIHSEGATLDAAVRLGIKKGMMYRLLGQPMDESKGILDSRSVLVLEREQVARKSEWSLRTQASSSTLRGLGWYEMTLIDAQGCEETPRSIALWNKSSAQDLVQVTVKLFVSE
jgi:hypothetical protein